MKDEEGAKRLDSSPEVVGAGAQNAESAVLDVMLRPPQKGVENENKERAGQTTTLEDASRDVDEEAPNGGSAIVVHATNKVDKTNGEAKLDKNAKHPLMGDGRESGSEVKEDKERVRDGEIVGVGADVAIKVNSIGDQLPAHDEAVLYF